MNKKIFLSTFLTGLVVVGTAIALASSPIMEPPTKPFPDLQGVTPPLDTQADHQFRAGTIDFSSSTSPLQMIFKDGQGVSFFLNDPSNIFSLFTGDLHITTQGSGIAFVDSAGVTHYQYTAANGLFRLGKLCEAKATGWSNTIVVQNSWTASDCNAFATSLGGSSYQLGCALPSGTSFGVSSGVNPNPNCGWDSSCLGAGPYYPSTPTGCATPQKVFALANQTSVLDGMASVSVAAPGVDCGSGQYCKMTCSSGSATPVFASDFGCGADILDDATDDNNVLCGTGNTYQVYCR